jgi:hypothetical protein
MKYCNGGLFLFSTSDATPAGAPLTSPTSATRPTAAVVVSENFILELLMNAVLQGPMARFYI